MANRLNLDDITESTDHAPAVHPLRALIEHHFYLDGWVSSEGGLSLLMMDALLLVPCVMFAFFYPMQTLAVAAVVLVVSFALFEAVVLWRRHGRVKT
jgi:hypothetical protein